MMYGVIPSQLHTQLLDHENYQNRTNGIEELKNIISELDLRNVSSDSVVEFIRFLHTLLDDTNFKVLYGTLQVINLLVQKLDRRVDRYYKQIMDVTVKMLGDTRTVPRSEYMNVFRQLMRIVGPQKVLELLIGHLKHRNSRVREDIINVITAAMLTHPRKDFDIPDLCYVIAPYLADGKKRVRHAALELFAVFDYCLDMGKKQPLVKAINKVELTGDTEGLMAAVQARRARHILPRLSADGMVEYALVVPKPGQRRRPQLGSGADLDWVLNGGRVNSAQSLRSEPEVDGTSGYGSLGSLTDDPPLPRRIVSAGKGKNKLPWDSGLPCSPVQNSASNGKTSDKSSVEDLITSFRLTQETSVGSWVQETTGRLRRSGSLDLDRDVFKADTTSESERAFPKPNRLLSGNSVERTFSLPSNPPLPGSFLLPSYPLATLTGVELTPTLPRRHRGDSSLSMSNTWPNKQEMRHSSPLRDNTGEFSSSRCSAGPERTSASSFHQSPAKSSSLIFPITQHRVQDSSQEDLLDGNLHLDLSIVKLQDTNDEPIDREEMKNSLQSLRNSAAKKREKVSLSGSERDTDSPDSGLKLKLTSDSPSTPVTSPLSESSLSSHCSPPSPITNGTKFSSGKTRTTKPHITRVSSGKQKTLPTMETGSQGVQQCERTLSHVSVVGQKVLYSNGSTEKVTSRDEVSPPLVRAAREPVRALRPVKGSQEHSTRISSALNMSEGVVGRGVFGFITLPTDQDMTAGPEQDDSLSKVPWEPPDGVYGHAVSVATNDSDRIPEAGDSVERMNLSRFTADKHDHRTEKESQFMLSEQVDRPCRTERRRQRQRPTASEMCAEESSSLNDSQLIGASKKTETFTEASSPTSLHTPRSPVKCFTPHYQPSPPAALPTRHTLPRRAASLNRTRPSVSNCSDEFTPATPKKEVYEQHELRPFSKPDCALTQSFRLLNSDDWEKKIEGLNFLRSLVKFHSDVLNGRLHDVCLVLVQEVRNLRSGVSRMAVVTLGELYSCLQKGMDQELEATARALLHKAGESNAFIRQDVDAALDSMVHNCTPTRSMGALFTGGLGHLNAVVRKCTAQHLATLVEKIGAGRLLSGTKDLTDRILPAVSRLAQDSSQETRYFGRRMLLLLSSHQDFDKVVAKYIPDKDLATLRDTVLTLKTKGLGEIPHETPSARGRRSITGGTGGGLVRASSLTREPILTLSKDSSKTQIHSIADKTEYIKKLKTSLGSKDFRERIRGIDQLVNDCETKPCMVIANMFPVFDAFKSRLQESNSKVNLYALEALQKIITLLKDNLAQVVYILVPAIVDNHLNSRNDAVYAAAIGGIHALVCNLDNTLLLQPFCTKAQFLSGKAKVDLVNKVAELVKELYPRKPQLVEQKVLPLLWHLLGSSHNSGTVRGKSGSLKGAVANLCQVLHAHMGPALVDCAASQTSNIHQSLNDVLKNLPAPQICS